MAIRRDSLTMKLAAALLAFVAVFLGVRALDGGSESLTGQPAGGCPGGRAPRRHHRSADRGPAGPGARGSRPIPTPTPSSGSPTSSRCARRATRPSIRGPRAPSSRRCGSIPETSPPPAASVRSPWPATTSAAALALGEQAARINPGVARNYGVIADAQIELGRYGAAERTLQHYVDVKPELSSYARVSYFRELHGDLPGALAAMRLAVIRRRRHGRERQLRAGAGREAPASTAATTPARSAPTGRRSSATRAFPPRSAGLARVEAARGDYRRRDPARYRGLVAAAAAARVRDRPRRDRAGRRHDGRRAARLRAGRRRDRGCCRRTASTPTSSWLCSRPTTAHPSQAVDLAARAWAAAPSVRSADALLLGPERGRAGRRGAAHVGAGDAARLARSLLPLPRRDGRPARRATRSGRTRFLSPARRPEPALQPALRPAGAAGAGGPAMSARPPASAACSPRLRPAA